MYLVAGKLILADKGFLNDVIIPDGVMRRKQLRKLPKVAFMLNAESSYKLKMKVYNQKQEQVYLW